MYQQIIIEQIFRSLRYKACQFDELIEEINVRICSNRSKMRISIDLFNDKEQRENPILIPPMLIVIDSTRKSYFSNILFVLH